jgi:hypothetical protein
MALSKTAIYGMCIGGVAVVAAAGAAWTNSHRSAGVYPQISAEDAALAEKTAPIEAVAKASHGKADPKEFERFLSDREPAVRAEACLDLAVCVDTSKKREAEAFVQKMVSDPDGKVRAAALTAMKRIDPAWMNPNRGSTDSAQ